MNSNQAVKTKPSSTKAKPKSKGKPKSKSEPKDNLIVVFDPGTSISKIPYVINDGVVKWITMGAEYFPLSSNRADSLTNDSNLGSPEDNAWIRTTKSGECHTVGLLASNQQATTSIKKSKQELLDYKILAAIGAIATREKLDSSFKLELGVLIPYNEYTKLKEDKDWSSNLKSTLSSFYFQTRQLKVKLSDLQCVPEGYGIASYLSQGEYAADFSNGNSAVIMLGYRNTSCLYFRRGTLDQNFSKTTTLFGFHALLEKMVEKVPTLEKKDLIRAISTKTEENWSYSSDLYNYKEVETKLQFEALSRKSESQQLEQAYQTSLSEYWKLLSDWLDEILPQVKEINLMVFGGGSYQLLKTQLAQYADSWDAECLETSAKDDLKKYLLWNDAPHKERFLKENLGVRFADAWGFFLKFADYDRSKTLHRRTGEVIAKNGN